MFEELIAEAEAVLKPRPLSSTAEAGSVAAALLTVYVGENNSTP